MAQRGRPLKFKTKKALDEAIDAYFAVTPKDEWTWTGLAIYLDTSRETLCDYKERPEFSDSIKKGLDKVANGYEIDLKKHGRSGTIFALKNFDWKDKQETDITSGGEKLPQPLVNINALLDNNNTKEDSQSKEEN